MLGIPVPVYSIPTKCSEENFKGANTYPQTNCIYSNNHYGTVKGNVLYSVIENEQFCPYIWPLAKDS